ncbi:MAG: carbohydrate binding domain-containing protein [Weeksellaceae bacterium]
MRKLLLIIIVFPFSMLAQQNLIPNGGFEDYAGDRPLNWTFSRFLNFEKSRDSHEGNYAAKFYPNGGSIYSVTQNYNYNAITVKPNSAYKFSFWYKGEVLDSYGASQKNILVSITWYKDNKRIKRDYFDGQEVLLTNLWQQKELIATVPIGVNKAGISFIITQSNSGHILLDDVSMIFQKKLEAVAPVPSNVNAVAHQREIELTWNNEADPDIVWEVVVNDGEPKISAINRFTIDDLKMKNNYRVKLRSKLGNEYSDYTNEINVTTNGLEYAVNDVERVPRLRTLGLDANVSSPIFLYFIDLAKEKAKIDYYIDGNLVTPKGKTLTFPKKGKQKLKVVIEESPSMKWELEYNITIKP